MTPSTLPDLLSFTRSGVSRVCITPTCLRLDRLLNLLFTVRYVQAGSRVEGILAKIREAIGGGVDYAEEKLSSVLEVSRSGNRNETNVANFRPFPHRS